MEEMQVPPEEGESQHMESDGGMDMPQDGGEEPMNTTPTLTFEGSFEQDLQSARENLGAVKVVVHRTEKYAYVLAPSHIARLRKKNSWQKKLDSLRRIVDKRKGSMLVLFRSADDILLVSYLPPHRLHGAVFSQAIESVKEILEKELPGVQVEDYHVSELGLINYDQYACTSGSNRKTVDYGGETPLFSKHDRNKKVFQARSYNIADSERASVASIASRGSTWTVAPKLPALGWGQQMPAAPPASASLAGSATSDASSMSMQPLVGEWREQEGSEQEEDVAVKKFNAELPPPGPAPTRQPQERLEGLIENQEQHDCPDETGRPRSSQSKRESIKSIMSRAGKVLTFCGWKVSYVDASEIPLEKRKLRVPSPQESKRDPRRGEQERRGGDKQRRGGDKQKRGGDKERRGGDKERRGENKERRGGDKERRGENKERRGGDKERRGENKERKQKPKQDAPQQENGSGSRERAPVKKAHHHSSSKRDGKSSPKSSKNTTSRHPRKVGGEKQAPMGEKQQPSMVSVEV